MNRLPEVLPTRMSVKERIAVRKKLSVSASEFELLELIGSGPMTLRGLAEELGLTVRGVDKSAGRLVEQGHLVKVAGKLHLSKACALCLNIELSSMSYIYDRSDKTIEQSYISNLQIEQSSTNGIEQSYISNLQIEQSSTPDIELSSTFCQKQEQSSTFSPDDSHAPAHGGSSNNIILNFETLKEEKKIKEKINPLPPDKKENQKKESDRRAEKRVFSEALKNHVADLGIVFYHLRAYKRRKAKRLKRLPKPKKVKVPNVGFDVWWNLYDYKVGPKAKLEKKWAALSDNQRILIMQHTPPYVASTPNKQYRKHPQTYLNKESWNDEIIVSIPKNGNGTGTNPQRSADVAPKSTPVFDLEAILAAQLRKGNSDQSGIIDTAFEYVD